MSVSTISAITNVLADVRAVGHDLQLALTPSNRGAAVVSLDIAKRARDAMSDLGTSGVTGAREATTLLDSGIGQMQNVAHSRALSDDPTFLWDIKNLRSTWASAESVISNIFKEQGGSIESVPRPRGL